MARYTGPKHKIARREGVNILSKASPSLERRINVMPGSHGKRRARKLSEYGIQLREKQKLKKIYGLLEKQFRNYVAKAQRKHINTEDALIQLLETRLDNVVFRLGFGKTRNQARQMVSHGHVYVNGARTSIPSYEIGEGDVVTIGKKFQTEELKARLEDESKQENALDFVKRKDLTGKLVKLPTKDDVMNPVNYQLVVEFYSR